MSRSSPADRQAVVKEYAELADVYDTRWSFYIRASVRETIVRLPNLTGPNLLDVGCGTGALLRALLNVRPDLIAHGIDASAEMLSRARQQLPLSVRLVRGWAEELPYADCAFDTVVSCNMFHFIHEPNSAVQNMLRVLKPGGTLVITDWCHDYVACRLCAWFLRYSRRSPVQILGTKHCRDLLTGAGAADVSLDRYRISWLWGLMTAVARRPES